MTLALTLDLYPDASGDVCSGNGRCTMGGGCQCDEGYWGTHCEGTCPVGGYACRLCVGVSALTVFVVAVVLASVWLPGVNGKVCSGQSQGVCSPNSGDCVCATGFTGESCQHAGTCQEHGTNCECEENGYWGPTCSNTCPGSTACVEVRARVDVGWSHEPCMRVWRPTVPSFCRAPAVQPRAPTTGSAPSQETAFVTKATMAPAANQVRTGSLVVMGQHRHTHTSHVHAARTLPACPSANELPCSGHSATGTCDKAGHCVCAEGWAGPECSTECPGGAANPCSGNGVCTATGLCSCNAGYAGTTCELSCPASGGQACSGHGSCTSTGSCACDRGYYGTDCSNECPGGAVSPCSGHGNCGSTGACVCALGYFGNDCSSTCPGGAATPCSNHGTCNQLTGACACEVGYFGSDCASQCARVGGEVCSGHGACTADGDCVCNAPYTGIACSDVYCPYDCYNHGSCDSTGVCHCQGPWSGIYCSQQTVNPLEGGTANFVFRNGYIRTREDVGTIYLNVTRGGSTFGEVYVSYQTKDASAHAHTDYMPTSGRLLWSTGDATDRQIQVDIVGDDHVEGLEAFVVYLFDPSPGSTVGDNATISISANGNDNSDDSAVVTVKIDLPEDRLRLSTAAGAQFASDFVADVCGPNVLYIPTDRVIVKEVQSIDSATSYLTFVILGDPSGPSTDDLAIIIWDQMQDPSSALYRGVATRYVDRNFQPVFKFSTPKAVSEPDNYLWLLGIFIPLAVLVGCGVVAYKRRNQLTEWLLWRLGNMRFNSLMRHRNLDLDEDARADSDRQRIDDSRYDRSGQVKPGDELGDARL